MNTKAILGIGAGLALALAVQLDGQEKARQPIAITGCLQRADARHGRGALETATGTVGTEQFVLTKNDAAHSSSRGSKAESTAGSASKKGAADGPWFMVTGAIPDLLADINQRVEITGTVDTTGSVLGTSASVTDGPSGTIHATAVKVVGASCGR